jgi:hypothetical protein
VSGANVEPTDVVKVRSPRLVARGLVALPSRWPGSVRVRCRNACGRAAAGWTFIGVAPVPPTVIDTRPTWVASLGAILSTAAAFALIATACDGAESASDSGRTSVPKPGAVEMTNLPASARRVCDVLPLIRRVCPRVVPEAPYASATAPPDFRGPSGGGAIAVCLDKLMRGISPASDRCENEILSIEAGHPTGPGAAGRDPPSYVHLLLYASRRDLTREPSFFPFPWPDPRPQSVRDGLLSKSRTVAIYLGERTWGRETGVLILAPPEPFGGESADHLIFRWRDGNTEYALSLHSWEPFTQTAKVLSAVVRSI